jgi:hypothetical protein
VSRPGRTDAEREHAVRVKAARLVVKLSDKLGKPVDPEVVRIAGDDQGRRAS